MNPDAIIRDLDGLDSKMSTLISQFGDFNNSFKNLR